LLFNQFIKKDKTSIMKKILFSLFAICTIGISFSQKTISNQNHAWVTYLGNHKITNKWGIHTEYQWRREDGFTNWQQSLMRLGVDYYVNPTLSATAGYGWIITYPYGDQPVGHQYNENRIWEQVNMKTKFGRFEVQHRYRLEQRFLENWVKDVDGNYVKLDNLFRQRIRYRAMVLVPLRFSSGLIILTSIASLAGFIFSSEKYFLPSNQTVYCDNFGLTVVCFFPTVPTSENVILCSSMLFSDLSGISSDFLKKYELSFLLKPEEIFIINFPLLSE
jgi:hypothetical protein